jgi:AAA ATPase domain
LVLVLLELVIAVTAAIHRRQLGPAWRPEQGNPYPVLMPYAANRSAVFLGREAEVLELATRVRTAVKWNERFVPIVGPSGCGKSSVVYAGLLPMLERDRAWLSRPLRPRFRHTSLPTHGDRLIEEMVFALHGERDTVARRLAADVGLEAIAAVDRAVDGLPPLPPETLLGMLARHGQRQRRLVMVMDQLEEAASPKLLRL